MKYIIIAFSRLLFITAILAQNEFDNRQYLEQQVKKYTRMRNAGLVLTGIGSVSAISGIVLAAQDENRIASAQGNNNPELTEGAIFVLAGVAMLVPGIIFTSRRAHKHVSQDLSFRYN